MTEYGAPFDGVLVGDAAAVAPYSAAEWARIWKLINGGGTLYPNYGVLAGSGDGTYKPLEVRATAVVSSNVEVQIGAALVDGRFYENTAVRTLAVNSNSSGNSRYDTVILRLDYVAQTIRLVIKQGTPAGSPVPPAMQQDATDWEIPLADILVPNGFTTIPQIQIFPRARVINTQSNGWESNVYPRGYAHGTALSSTLAINAAQTLLIPFSLAGNMLLDSVIVGGTSALSGTVLAWDLYIQDVNDVSGSGATIRRLIEGGSNSSIPTIYTNSVIPVSSLAKAMPLTPGLYWLALQNRHASNIYTLSMIPGNAFDVAINKVRRKTTTNPNGATLDAATGWTSFQEVPAVCLRGRIFGETSAA